MKIRIVLLSLLVLALLTIPVAAQTPGASISLAMTSDPNTFDPHGPIDPSAPVVLAYVYDTLVHQNEEGMVEPLLATDWTVSQGGRSITFDLRDDVVFSNGAPFNADSVIFSLQRIQEIGQRTFIFSEMMNIAEFVKVDDYTVTLNLRAPSVTLLSALSYAYAAMLEPGAVAAAGEYVTLLGDGLRDALDPHLHRRAAC